MNQYLSETPSIDYHHPEIQKKVSELQESSADTLDYLKQCYYFVRDEIPHSWDIQASVITKTASEALIHRTGICWTKSCLLAALLRANGIPSGISYQLLLLNPERTDDGYMVHALNTVYLQDTDRWIRLDARGNGDNVHAEFSLEKDQLEYSVRTEAGEHDFKENHADLDERLVKLLAESSSLMDIRTDFTDL